MHPIPFNLLVPIAFSVALAVAPAWAAPLKPMPNAGAAAEVVSDEGEDTNKPTTDWAAEAVPGTGRTMELLLEMQKNTPAERAAPEAVRKAGASRATAPSLLADQGLSVVAPGAATGLGGSAAGAAAPGTAATRPVLFGTTDEPAIRPSAGPEPRWEGAERSGSPGQRPRHGASEVPAWMRWPAEFIAWLRQNRYSVVAGALGTLLVVWVGSLVMGRRRYAG